MVTACRVAKKRAGSARHIGSSLQIAGSQRISCGRFARDRRCCRRKQRHLISVSYTHLDVYKRQALMKCGYTSQFLRSTPGTTCTNTVLWSCRSAHKRRSANGAIDTACHTEKMFTSVRSLDWQSFGTEPMPTPIGISGPSQRHKQFFTNPGSSLSFGVLARGGGIFELTQLCVTSGQTLWVVDID